MKKEEIKNIIRRSEKNFLILAENIEKQYEKCVKKFSLKINFKKMFSVVIKLLKVKNCC